MSGIASVISTRPDWTRGITGITYDCAVRVCGASHAQVSKPNIVTSRNRVSLISVDSGAAKPEDEYEVNFVYGPDATNADITKRHIEPLVRKAVEGYNATVMVFGASGSGKTLTLEGTRAHDGRGSSEGDGIVHLGIDLLFKLLNDKAVSIGEKVAQQRRMPGSKAYDFFVETSFVEVYNETCHDLYQKGDAVRANLPVYEDESEGYQISGLTYRVAKSDKEMRTNFNYGRLMRETQVPDIGSVHERSAAMFTVYIAQYSPAVTHGQEDNITVSRLTFVDMPGAERLAVDPELLRLREGLHLNKGLLSFASTVSTLARDGSSQFVNYDESLLVKLLSEALGGNSMALMLGTLKQGDWEGSSATLQLLMNAKKAKNYPIINHGRARGLLQKLRRRLLAVLEDRETLREQLNEVPADGDPNSMAVSIARVRDLEARLNAEREELATLNHEKQALQARLSKLREAETGDLQERSELQEALVRSEELRLALARTLIDAQMDMVDREQEWADEKLELEKRLAELEAAQVQEFVKADDHMGVVQSRDELNAELLSTQEALARREAEVEELKRRVEEQQLEIRKLNQELNLIGGGEHGTDDLPLEGEGDGDDESVESRRRKLFMALKAKTRQIAELQSTMKEMQAEIDTMRNQKTLTRAALDEVREAYRRKLETAQRDIAELSRAVAIMQDDPKTGLKITPEDLFNTFQRLADENIRVTEEREKEMRRDLDEMHGRHVELKRKFRTLYLAYRQLRYLVEDKWPPQGHPPPPQVPTEDQVLGAAFDDIARSEEEADRRLMARLRERTSHLDSQLAALKLAEAAGAKGVKLKASNLSTLARDQYGTTGRLDAPDVLRFENEKLREELERYKGLLGPGPGQVNERLLKENAMLVSQMKSLSTEKSRSQLAAEVARLQAENEELRKTGGGSGSAVVKDAVRDFNSRTHAELERKLAHAEARRVMAEEQLESMQKYLSKATVQYQTQIVRLRTIIGQMDPRMLKSNPLKGA